ncbi:MAG TPA: ABC transporter ATP-binding protein [Bacteroidales bacterium]|nr:ABC transporter ATP-binding protein [Bacteroidales bacterium]
MKEKYNLFRKSLKLVWESTPGWTAANTVVSVLRSIFPFLLLLLLKKVIDVITSEASASGNITTILIPVAALALVWFIDEALADAAGFFSSKQAMKFEDHMYDLLHTKASETDLLNFEDPEYYDCLSRAKREATWRPNNILHNLVSLSRSLLSLLLITGLILSFHWLPAVILILANIPGIWLRLHYAGVLYDFKREQTTESRKAAYYNWLLTGDRPAREMRLFGLGKYFKSLFRESFLRQKEEELDILRKRVFIGLVSDLIKASAILVIVLFIASETINGTISLGSMAMFLLAFRQGMIYLKELLGSVADLYEDGLFIGDTFEFLDLQPVISGSGNVNPATLVKKIEVENLSFSYPGNGKKIIDNISFTLNKGEVLGIVGHNGAGKSTLVRLLARLYEADSGTIKYDGEDIRKLDPDEYRKQFSIVFQDFMLYNLSAGENIKLGWIDANDTGRMNSSAMKAGIHDLIKGLPAGYDTRIGNLFDDSRELSWGEWQKIAIARALYRVSPVLILDEPSSSLDADTEYEIFSRFREIVKERTTILISHRLNYISLADRIIVMENGRIAETGSHSDLMKIKGLYHSMFTKQASRFEL